MLITRSLLITSLLMGAALPALPAAAAEILTKSQISQQIIGKTMTTSRKGMRVRMTYNVDGTVAMKALVMSASGTWKYNGDGVCMQMNSGPRKGETCVTFESLGDNKYRNSEGMILTVQN
ncbi:MAG: hypothetical protein L3J30_05040 [Marinosulfonomonas sp.]|nr:hypothetical protein [Marinosulfonomonas sp.]